MPRRPARSPASPSVRPGSLAASDQLLAAAFRAIPDPAVITCWADGRVVDANDALQEVAGYRRDQVLGRSVLELGWWPDAPAREAYLEELRRNGQVRRYPSRIPHASGELRDVLISATPIELHGTRHILAVAQDVTDAQRVQRALSQSEQRYRELINAVNDGFFEVDHRGAFLVANQALAAMHGLPSPEALLGRPFTDFLAAAAREELAAQFREGIEAGTLPAVVTTPIVRPDGSEAILEIKPVAVVEGGRVVGARGVVRDITERVRAQKALQLSHSILEHVGDLVIVAGADGGIRYASPSVSQVLGYHPSEVLGEGWWQLTFEDPVARDRERAAVARAARGEEPPRTGFFERAVKTRDGRTRWILFHESKGPEELLLGVGVDVTERRLLEQQFRQAQKMEAVGRLAAGIAHDFNNLLTVITGYAELVLGELPVPDSRRKDLEEIRQAAQQAAALTGQLLAFGRQQVAAPEVIELDRVIAGMQGMLQRLIGEDIELRTELAAAGRVRADPHQIEQVILNLAVNARDAMPEGGVLRITTRDIRLEGAEADARSLAAGPYVELVVSDTGVGMSDEVLAQVFEPFFTTKPPGKGTGLGLATVYGIVRQNQGAIAVTSQPGRGATFTIYLPQVRDAASAPAAAPPPGAAILGDGQLVLLVEDDAAVRRLAAEALSRHGYRVLEAGSPPEALELAAQHLAALDLVITDQIMPLMRGRALERRLHHLRPDLPVLYVSGYAGDPGGADDGLPPGAPFLAKPFSPQGLVQKVREVLATRRSR